MILTSITLRVSSTGILMEAIANTGIFSSSIEKTFVILAESEEVINKIRKLAIQKPKKSDPASPTNSFFLLEKLCFKKTIIEAINTTETTEWV